MDGKTLLYRLRNLLNEDSDTGWLDKRSTYDYLYEAAIEFVDRTGCLRSSQTITTVADTQEYDLNADFLRLYVKTDDNEFFVRYTDSTSSDFNLTWKDYEEIFYDHETTSQDTPSKFTVIDVALESQLTGTCTTTDSGSGNESTLTDSAGDFSNAAAGDIVHNTTDGSDGIVLAKTSSTQLETALFGGTNNYWTSSDAYVIQPQARYKLVLDAPCSNASETITVPYVQRPAPVYADYRVYRFPIQYVNALVKYAFWLYKYRDREPDYGDAMYKFWDAQTRRYGYSINRAQRNNRMMVNLRKRQR